MTISRQERATGSSTEVLTPTVRQGARRAAFWIAVALVLLVLAAGVLATAGTQAGSAPFAPDSAAPDGSRAVVEVLRDEGVTVTATASLDQTAEALDTAPDATVLVYDQGFLDADGIDRLLSLTDRLVLVDPDFDLLAAVAPGVLSAGSPDDDPLEAACTLPAAEAAGSVPSTAVGSDGPTSGTASAYRVDAGTDAEACLRSDSAGADPAYSLVGVNAGGVDVSVLGAVGALQNGSILAGGNAALALNLLGERTDLIWYLPSIADELDAGDPGLLTPGWVLPTILLAGLVFVAAAVWRGRRFGPLIVENLPVVVRSNETMEGRARLYQQSSARLRALDALRIGAIGRLARATGLPSTATVDDVVPAVAAAVRADVRGIRFLLVDAVPSTDAELVRMSDELLAVERAVAANVRP